MFIKVIPILLIKMTLGTRIGSPPFSLRFQLFLSKIRWLVFLFYSTRNGLRKSEYFACKVTV